ISNGSNRASQRVRCRLTLILIKVCEVIVLNLSPSSKKYFKIDRETNEEIQLEQVSERNNVLYTSRVITVAAGDSIKIIDVDGFEEIRKVRDSGKELYRQKIILG
ncbi:hypothetical protein, partial [Acinetobacter baumannii]|uniref:hypothetical protein n=2 Tax=Acinetobacter baumannii TaxID=470 RepID=UPI00313F2299